MEYIGLCGILGACAWEDWKTKEIHVGALVLMAFIGLVGHLLHPQMKLWELLAGAGVGVILYGISILSREQIGRGDALCFMATGLYLGLWNNLCLLWTSFLLAGVVGFIYGKVRHLGGNARLPFLPFVFVSMLALLGMGGLG
ncbi:MAG: prepilin peptidase [Lachnospiraceae bacterium]|nr:prepilin peptidase [Lachnospiraceae bacterium]